MLGCSRCGYYVRGGSEHFCRACCKIMIGRPRIAEDDFIAYLDLSFSANMTYPPRFDENNKLNERTLRASVRAPFWDSVSFLVRGPSQQTRRSRLYWDRRWAGPGRQKANVIRFWQHRFILRRALDFPTAATRSKQDTILIKVGFQGTGIRHLHLA